MLQDCTVLQDINLPVEQIEIVCGNKNCRAVDKIGVSSTRQP